MSVARVIAWIAFFATSVYGHAAMKIAADRGRDLWTQVTSFWGISALVSWTASSLLWIRVLEGSSLLSASTISSLRYVLLTLIAVFVFRESIDARAGAGCMLIAFGVWLVVR